MGSVQQIASDYLTQLHELGVANGDLLLVHSRMGNVPLNTVLACFQALRRIVAPQGTVAFPTFNFSFCKGVPFDYIKTPSQMGLLSEFARRDADAEHIYHPIYSFALFGKMAQDLSEKIKNVSSYGNDSFFGEMRRRNGKILIINLSYNESMTFFHHVEEMVGCAYRYIKSFTGKIIDETGATTTKTYTMLVRDLDQGVVTNVEPAGKILEEKGLVRYGKLGRWDVKLLKAGDVFDVVKEFPQKNPELMREIRK